MIRYGFYDYTNEKQNKYYASDVSLFLRGLFGNGYFPGVLNEFKAEANNDLNITLKSGKWWIAGFWCLNDSDMQFNVSSQAVISSTLPRIDRIVMRHNNSATGQSMEPVYKVGVASSNPQPPALVGDTEDDIIYEMPICQIYVKAGATVISASDITDEREKIKWLIDIGSNVIYDYIDATITTSGTQYTFNIPSAIDYKPAKGDKLEVYVNGMRLKNSEYTKTDTTVTITNGVLNGNDVTFVNRKILNTTGVTADLVEKINDLSANMNEIKKYHYFCNGVNDNIALSDMVQEILNDTEITTGYAEVIVHGKFVVSGYYSGGGTNANPYKYFNFGSASAGTKKVIVNFINSSQIGVTLPNTGVYAVLFSGYDIYIKNISLSCAGGGTVYGFNGQDITVENANINISATGAIRWGKDGAVHGNYINNRVSIASTSYNAVAFYSNGGILRVVDCEAYAYTGDSTYQACAILVEANATSNVLIAERNNFPIKTRSGYSQTSIIKVNSGYYSLVSNIVGSASLLYATGDGKTNTGEMVVSKIV